MSEAETARRPASAGQFFLSEISLCSPTAERPDCLKWISEVQKGVFQEIGGESCQSLQAYTYKLYESLITLVKAMVGSSQIQGESSKGFVAT